ncbi:MAG: PhoH family protein, partial [Oscillospiraceae bacterium]|nr:PhoH family protein [Oscillospiraceae bacterium]
MSEILINVDRLENVINVFGSFDENLRLLEGELGVKITDRNSELCISGDEDCTSYAERAIGGLLALAAKGEQIDSRMVRYIIGLVKEGQEGKIGEITRDVICISAKGKPIKAKTIGQKKYIDAVLANTVTLSIGPAGTGKTYLAVAAAVAAFRSKSVNRIILTRPAVEAGERLGFLPGDMQSKVDPYLRPLYDALFDLMGVETYNKYLERGN